MQKLVGAIMLIVLPFVEGLFFDMAMAAKPARPLHIGALTASWGPTPSIVALRDGLLELGYQEDVDFVLGVRFTQGDVTALPTAARELVQYGVDIILASEDESAKAAQQATAEVPIVFLAVSNPVELGLIKSFAKPGGNITGVSDLGHNLHPKRLELLQATVSGLQRVLFPYSAVSPIAAAEAQLFRKAAQRLGIELIERKIQTQGEAQSVLSQIRHGDVDAIMSPRCCSLNIPGYILAAMQQQKIPAMFESAFWANRGGLVSYGPDYYGSGKQAARLVDKIIKGTKPAELPVEVNSKIEFAINLKTAKTLGITIPPTVLFQATEVIR